MTRIAVSRRNLLATGACALVGAVSLPGSASASAFGGQTLTNEGVVDVYKRQDHQNWRNMRGENKEAESSEYAGSASS